MRLGVFLVLAGCGGSGVTTPDAGDAPDADQGEVAEVHLIGRFDADRSAGWPGSQIRARFDGTSLTMTLGNTGVIHYDVEIDGEVSLLTASAGEVDYQLATGLAPGEHTVIVTRRSESFFGTTTFGGFSGATLVPSAGPTRRIEMVGDSITCGYGVLGAEATCPFDIDTEAETHAWGALAARELGAVHTAIAYSGKGVYRNYGGDPNEPMPVIFERTFADQPGDWDFSTPAPDVVVIGLGTNDFSTGDPEQPFVDAYVDLVAQIRGHYPDAWIVLAESPMLGGADHTIHAGYLADVVEASGGEAAKVETLAIAVQLDADGYGCDYHPNEVTQQKMADALVAELEGLLGW